MALVSSVAIQGRVSASFDPLMIRVGQLTLLALERESNGPTANEVLPIRVMSIAQASTLVSGLSSTCALTSRRLARSIATALPAIPWKRGHFPLADSCNFASSSEYRTPVHLWFLASACAPGAGSPDAPRPGRGRPGPARVSCRRGRSGLRGQGRPRRGRRRQAVRSSLEAGGAAPYP
jgi:hypothetical protein